MTVSGPAEPTPPPACPDLICYTRPGWAPRIRPASPRRDWMEETPERFAYRCLPLAIANAHGWEVLNPCGFEARWTGGCGVDAVEIRLDPGSEGRIVPVSLFGEGVITFHLEGVFRTSGGWNLMVGGPPNSARDGIAPLSGVVETDWSPYSFTMNWRFTRPNHWVRFEEDEPFCFLFPVPRGMLSGVRPRIAPMADEPGLDAAFERWSASRDAFQAWVAQTKPEAPADKWQKLYYRGVRPDGSAGPTDHEAKLRLCPFGGDARQSTGGPQRVATIAETATGSALSSRRREWIASTQLRQRMLVTDIDIPRIDRLSGRDFLHQFYALSRPVVVTGMIDHWPALRRWSPDYLKQAIGSAPVEYQCGRNGDPDFELYKDNHKRTDPFDRFIDRIAEPGNDAYLTAYNSGVNRAALAALDTDMDGIDAYLTREPGMMWIGPADTFTPLHFDLTNNLIVQATGTKELLIAPPTDTERLYNRRHVFSEVHDLDDPARLDAWPLAREVQPARVTLHAGDMLFVPVGWWHQVRALTFSVTLTFTNFHWPNDAWEGFPADN